MSDFDEIADELYGLRPDAFAAARDEQVRKARAEGRQPLAKELGQLRKPTQSAWLLNLLWRDQRDVMQQFFEVAEGLSRAQAQASGAELRSLNDQRRHLEAALIRQARALAEKAGVSVTASTEREAQETLAAALARSDVADEVRTGRLVKPAAYAGFGTPISAEGAAATQRPPAALVEKADKADTPDKADREERRARARRDAIEAAERRVREARAALEVAADALAEHGRAAEQAQQHAKDVAGLVEEARERLRDLERQAAHTRDAALDAARARLQADKGHDAAASALERAEKNLADQPSA